MNLHSFCFNRLVNNCLKIRTEWWIRGRICDDYVASGFVDDVVDFRGLMVATILNDSDNDDGGDTVLVGGGDNWVGDGDGDVMIASFRWRGL